MLEIEKETIGAVPLLRLRGRFDSYGATLFDQQVASPGTETGSLVLDLSQVGYLSSMGVRSLLKLGKAVKGKGGGVVLLDVPPFLKKALKLSGVLSHFPSAFTLEEALRLAEGSTASSPGGATPFTAMHFFSTGFKRAAGPTTLKRLSGA